MVEDLDDGHLGPEALPHRAQLEPDIAAADDDEPLRHAVERQAAGRRYDALFVDIDARQQRAFRARRNDDRAGFDLLRGTIGAGGDNPPRGGDPSLPLKPIDFVLAEQELDTPGQS